MMIFGEEKQGQESFLDMTDQVRGATAPRR